MIDFRMPSLGADMETGTLREWRKKVGDPVKRGDIIADVETQKGLIEIEVFDEGTVHELLLKEDEKVPVGTIISPVVPVARAFRAPARSWYCGSDGSFSTLTRRSAVSSITWPTV